MRLFYTLHPLNRHLLGYGYSQLYKYQHIYTASNIFVYGFPTDFYKLIIFNLTVLAIDVF